jgi:hypothetical protein
MRSIIVFYLTSKQRARARPHLTIVTTALRGKHGTDLLCLPGEGRKQRDTKLESNDRFLLILVPYVTLRVWINLGLQTRLGDMS